MSYLIINAQTTKKAQTTKNITIKTVKNKKGEPKEQSKSSSLAKNNSNNSPKSTFSKTKTTNTNQSQVDIKSNYLDESLRLETFQNITRDDVIGEDLEVRNAALNALGKESGTVVVMEPNTGKILSIVNQDWAIRKTFKPCSTIKLVTGIAALSENAIDEKGNVKNYNFPMGLTDALAYSNNSYFQLAGASIGQRKFFIYARALGLGEPTGINAENEASGKIPSYKFGSEINRSYSHGDDFEVTAIQLATLVSTITNGGKVVVPKIPREQMENTSFVGFMKRELSLRKEILHGVIPGMLGAVNYGTAQKSFEPTLNILGKTGSCIADDTWLGLFASTSSVINPKLAVVVITKGSSARGSKSAEIASKIYSLLAFRLRQTPDAILNEPYMISSPKVSPKISAQLDTAKSDDSDEKTTALNYRKSYENIKASFKDKPKIPNNSNANQINNSAPINTSQINKGVRPRIVMVKN